MPNDEVAPRLYLATINASIVGISYSNDTSSIHNYSFINPTNDDNVTINGDFYGFPRVCYGLGFVRAIDVIRKEIHIITPIDANDVDTDITCLMKGSLVSPNVLIYTPHHPIYPYMSGIIITITITIVFITNTTIITIR